MSAALQLWAEAGLVVVAGVRGGPGWAQPAPSGHRRNLPEQRAEQQRDPGGEETGTPGQTTAVRWPPASRLAWPQCNPAGLQPGPTPDQPSPPAQPPPAPRLPGLPFLTFPLTLA